jgi:hypothetical protein
MEEEWQISGAPTDLLLIRIYHLMTIDSTESTSLPTNGFNHGPIYLAKLTTSSFYFQGETNYPQEQISLCSSPLFAPVTLLGQCGEDVTVTIQFQSNDPLEIANPFPADVEWQLI